MSEFHVNQISTHLEDNYAEEFGNDALERENNLSRLLAARAIDLVLASSPTTRTSQIEITDGEADRGIDAVGMDRSSKLIVLVQSKWRKDGRGSMDLSGILKFLDGVRSLLGMQSEGDLVNASTATRQAIMDLLQTPGARIRLLTATTASDPLAPPVEQPIEELLAQLNDLEGSEPLATHRHFGQSDFFNSLTEIPTTAIDLDIQLQDWGRALEPVKILYGRVNAADIAGWYRDHGDALFTDNIRVVLPRSDINEGIRDTVRDEAERFGYYNNGITVIAEEIEGAAAGTLNREVAYLRLKKASIVNGAQTVSTLGSVLGSDCEENLGGAFVLVRCIEVPADDETLARRITRYANTQNEVSTQDFAFLDKEQHRLVSELGVMGFEYVLRSAETPRTEDPSRIIHVRDAAIALACASPDLALTVIAKREISRLFSSEGGVYGTLFNPATNALRLVRTVLITRAVDSALDELEGTSGGIEAGVAVHGRRMIAHLVMRDIGDEVLDSPDTEISDLLAGLPQSVRTHAQSLVDAFPDNSYPGNVFKNQARCAELLEDADLRGSKAEPRETGRLF